MRKITAPWAYAVTAALITATMFMVSNAFSLHAQARPVSSYGEDRAEIEDLQARYLFALDFHDPIFTSRPSHRTAYSITAAVT
jgi:hypothetical protein